MFPTFISILDVQSWWEVPSIAHFCSLFRSAFKLLDFDIEDLEEALLTDGTEEPSWLQELIVRLLSGCLPSNEISTSNYQMFLRRLFRQKCQEHDRYNPFNTDIDFQVLPLRTKVDILHALCDFRLDADDVLEQLKNLEADSLRVEPLGYDSNESAYWYFYGTRLYREDFKTKNNKKKSVWQVICFTEEDWFQLNKKFKRSTAKCERQLYRTLSENFLPELPRLFREKERLARKRLLENQPRRTSRRLRKENCDKGEDQGEEDTELTPKKVSNVDKQPPKKRKKLIPTDEIKESSDSDSDEMGGDKLKQKKTKASRQRKVSTSSTNSKEESLKNSSKRRKNSHEVSKSSSSSNTTTTTVGRQTNNSLAAATGQIVIQSVANTHKKKLKTSQVFRQSDEDVIVGMHKILDYVKNHEDAWPFADPVDEEYAPNYYSVIRKPMDLQRMEDRLDAGYYKNFDKFRDDFQLIVDNCRLYNGAENEYTEMVDNLSKVFKRATEKFLDQISSSDDEIAVEFTEVESKEVKKPKSDSNHSKSKRKPTLVAKTDKKRDVSISEDSLDGLSDTMEDKKTSNEKEKTEKKNNKIKKETKKKSKDKKDTKSPVRSRSRSPGGRGYSSSPPPSSVPSSPDGRFDFFPKKKRLQEEEERSSNAKGKQKPKHDTNNSCDTKKVPITSVNTSPKPKDKHNKLRETIEKLKAKSEITSKLTDNANLDLSFDLLDTPKENKDKNKKQKNKKENKKDIGYDSGNSIVESIENKRKKGGKNNIKNASIEELSIVTEQTLKDINKWLDDTPKFTDYSSASNSPSYPPLDEFDRTNDDSNKKKPPSTKKDISKDIKRRMFSRDPVKFLKRREIQRTIDRLQPGKSKGNLISSVQKEKSDETFPTLAKNKDSKNSLIVKTDDGAPKLSLGSVLDSFGRHKFVDDAPPPKTETEEEEKKKKDESKDVKVEESKEMGPVTEESMMSSATPNLSAWFKAFGTPKVQSKKEKGGEEIVKKEETKSDVVPPSSSPSAIDGQPGQPIPRQRKISTGSSVSERSSFSQDMDSPRVGMDERMAGAYPAPYPSPLHRSPSSGASPQLQEMSPKGAPYPPFNGQIRVGFYQDTASNKSSPDKSCSPRDNPQSPYTQSSEHVYTPNTTQMNYAASYPASPYYSHTNYTENPPPNYYDTNKPLTEQYQQQKTHQEPIIEQQSVNKTDKTPVITQNNNNNVFPVKKRAYNNENVSEEMGQQPKAMNEPTATPAPVISSYSYPNEGYDYNMPTNDRKLDLSKYTNMGYTGSVQYNRGDLYSRATPTEQQENLHYSMPEPHPHHHQNPVPPTYSSSLEMQNPYKTDVTIPRPTYNTMDMRNNMAQHMVDRYGNDERIYYGGAANATDKTGTVHSTMSSNSGSALPLFNQPSVQSYSQTSTSMYERQMAELQTLHSGDGKNIMAPQQTQVQEKKGKKRKSSKNASQHDIVTASSAPAPPPQGFQSYSGIKPVASEPNAISLKTASVVPGSAFNFGPAPTALNLYHSAPADNLYDEFRGAPPNYYQMAAAAAAHRDKQPRPDAQTASRQPPPAAYPPYAQATPTPNYYMGAAQGPSPSAALYQHYLQQASVLNPTLLAPGAYPPPGAYHHLSMRQQYDPMTRPPWL